MVVSPHKWPSKTCERLSRGDYQGQPCIVAAKKGRAVVILKGLVEFSGAEIYPSFLHTKHVSMFPMLLFENPKEENYSKSEIGNIEVLDIITFNLILKLLKPRICTAS